VEGTTAVVGDDGTVASAAVEKARSRREKRLTRLENRDSNSDDAGASRRANHKSTFEWLDQTFLSGIGRFGRSPQHLRRAE